MDEFNNNLPLQVFSRSNDNILLNFSNTSKLIKIINYFLQNKMAYGSQKIEREVKNEEDNIFK